MSLRRCLLFGVAALMAAEPALAQQQRPPARGTTPRANAVAKAAALPRTLQEALVATYSYNPALLAARASLRATDEGVPQALAGWRPTVIVAGSAGYGDGTTRQYLASTGWEKAQTDRDIATAQATVTQPLYTGGRVGASVHRAKNAVYAARANLVSQEETAFGNTVNAYVGVIEARQLLAIQINNEQVLQQQLQATQDRFRVGEVTQTDVAQSQAALASATASRLSAEGSLNTAVASYIEAVGSAPAPDLVPPQPLKLPVRSQQEAATMASDNNPSVIAALFTLAGGKNAVDVAFGALLPQVSLQGQTFQSNNASGRSLQSNGYQVIANVSVPLYQGGSEYSAVRQARETVQQDARLVGDARRTAVQNAVSAWETLQSAQAAAQSSRVAIQAGVVAVEGVERQALVGTATTLDVLTQQQDLLNARITLVQNLSQVVSSSYSVASAVGRLTARDLGLPVALYDETAYYESVKNKWWGVGVPNDETFYHEGQPR